MGKFYADADEGLGSCSDAAIEENTQAKIRRLEWYANPANWKDDDGDGYVPVAQHAWRKAQAALRGDG